MKILLTGAFGFVGTNLSKALGNYKKYYLTAIDIKNVANHIYDEYHSWNELEKINWSGVDVIIHLAGKAHDTTNTTEEQAYFDINVGLTKKIFEYFLKSNASKFIFLSSVKAVADSVKSECLTEEAEPNPGTAYGRSKLEAEEFIERRMREREIGRKGDGMNAERFLSVSRRIGMTGGKKVYILRPCMIHGPGNKGNLNLLYKLVSKGISWPLGAFENKRSFTSLENLTFIIQQIIKKDIKPGTYQLADDEALSTNRIVELIAAAQGKKTRIWRINKKLIAFFAKVGDKFHLPLNTERLKKLTESYVVSNKKLKNALGIEKMPVSAEDGMRKTLSSF